MRRAVLWLAAAQGAGYAVVELFLSVYWGVPFDPLAWSLIDTISRPGPLAEAIYRIAQFLSLATPWLLLRKPARIIAAVTTAYLANDAAYWILACRLPEPWGCITESICLYPVWSHVPLLYIPAALALYVALKRW
jgi:hypothetical protein